jgi:ABC-2 type transport system permease protein
MKILAMAHKDLKRSTRSLFLVGMTLAAPLLITGLMYFAFGSMQSGDVRLATIRVGLVNADTLPAGAPLEASIGQSVRGIFFDDSVKSWIAAFDYPDEAAARSALERQEIDAAVIIPPVFTADYLAGAAPAVVVLQDPALTIAPTVVRDMVASLLGGVKGGGVAYRVVTERLAAQGKTLDGAGLAALIRQYGDWYAGYERAMFHTPQEAALAVQSPAAGGSAAGGLQLMMGLIMAGQLIFFSFFTGAYAMTSILQEAEEGTLARMFVTPTARTAILAGKFLAVFLTVLIQGAVLLIAGRLIFGVAWGEPGAVALALLGQMLAAVGLGVLLVSFIKTSRQAGPVFGGGLTALGMISGLFTTTIAMPAAFNALGRFTPQGWVLAAWKLALAGNSAADLVVPFLVLAGMGIVMFAAGAAMFRRRFVSGGGQ